MCPARLVCAAVCVLGWAACWPADDVVFPRPKPRNRSCCSQLSVPVSLARQLSLVSTPEQFLSQYVVDGESLVERPARVPDFAFRSSFTDAPKSPPLAVCKPELRTLSLRDTDDPTVVYYPACVRLEQCGGCCNHQLLECQAKNMSKVNVTIQIAKYTGANRLHYQGKKVVTLSRHDSCQCDCKVKPEDCNDRQSYKAEECRCVCADSTEEKECGPQPKKLWNPSTCQCRCRDQDECSTGFYWDETKCSCTKNVQWQNYDRFFYRRDT